MGENSNIAWTNHTFNPWVGCQKISEGCANCYAEVYDRRVGGVPKKQRANPAIAETRWGPQGRRTRTSAANWKLPLKWNEEAAATGTRPRVFCSSLADVFEDRPELVPWRRDLFDLIVSTPNLDWLLLTKRPYLIRPLIEGVGWANGMRAGGGASMARAWWGGSPPANVWLGTTVEDQQRANERIPALLSVPAKVRFLSCEPLLERVDLSRWLAPTIQPPGINWVIVGGESGQKARPFELRWARHLMRQCRTEGVAFFMKQLGACAVDELNGVAGRSLVVPAEAQQLISQRLRDPAGGDPAEWPADLRVREFPEVAP